MKVLRTVPSFPPTVTGPANTAYELTHRLESRGVDHHVLTTPSNEEMVSPDGLSDLDVYRIKPSFGPDSYAFTPSILRFLHNLDFEIIHAHSYRNAFTDMAFFYSKVFDIPFVLHGHGTLLGHQWVTSGSSFVHRGHDILTRKRVAIDANALIVSTKQEKNEAIQFGVDQNSIHLITEGKDIDHYNSIPKNSNSADFVILFVGRIASSRNVDDLIRSLPLLEDDVYLRIVGGDVELTNSGSKTTTELLRKVAIEQGVEHRVNFVGPKYGIELIKEYRNADVFAYVSSYENFSQPIVEAALAGLPIVSTPTGIAPEIIEPGCTGYLVPYNDSKMIAERVQNIRSLNVEAMGKEIQNVAASRFAWDPIVSKHKRLYEDLVKRNGNAGNQYE